MPGPIFAGARMRMRKRRALTRRDDGIESGSVGAEFAALVIDFSGKRVFRHPDLNRFSASSRARELRLTDSADERDFALVLDHPQLRDQAFGDRSQTRPATAELSSAIQAARRSYIRARNQRA